MAKKIHRIVILAGCVYFVQGALGVSGIALPLFLRSLGWSIPKITAVSSLVALPWVFKIIYGFISDSIPLWGYRRKSYLVLYSILSMLGWLLLVVLPPQTASIALALIITNLGFAATDVVTDGLIVEYSKGTVSSLLQSIAWGTRSLGALISGVVGGWLAARWDPQAIFSLTMLLPLPVLIISFWIAEPVRTEKVAFSMKDVLGRCAALFKKGPMASFIAVLLILSTSSSFGVPFFFYMKETLRFQETFLGALSSLVWGGAVAGSLIYFRWLRKLPMSQVLTWAILMNSLHIFSVIFIVEPITAIVLSFTAGVMGCISLLSIMTASAGLTHGTGIEGTFFAVLMGVFNLGQIAFGYLGGRVFVFIGLHPLILITGVAALTGLFFVRRAEFHMGQLT